MERNHEVFPAILVSTHQAGGGACGVRVCVRRVGGRAAKRRLRAPCAAYRVHLSQDCAVWAPAGRGRGPGGPIRGEGDCRFRQAWQGGSGRIWRSTVLRSRATNRPDSRCLARDATQQDFFTSSQRSQRVACSGWHTGHWRGRPQRSAAHRLSEDKHIVQAGNLLRDVGQPKMPGKMNSCSPLPRSTPASVGA